MDDVRGDFLGPPHGNIFLVFQWYSGQTGGMTICLRGSNILLPTLNLQWLKFPSGFLIFVILINIHENTNNIIIILIHDINNFVKWYYWCNNNVSQW